MRKDTEIKELEKLIKEKKEKIFKIWGNSQDGSYGAAYYHEVKPLVEKLKKLKGE